MLAISTLLLIVHVKMHYGTRLQNPTFFSLLELHLELSSLLFIPLNDNIGH